MVEDPRKGRGKPRKAEESCEKEEKEKVNAGALGPVAGGSPDKKGHCLAR